MKQKYVILRQSLPSELTFNEIRNMIANHYRIEPDEVLMSCVDLEDRACMIRTKVKDENGRIIGQQG